MRTKHERKKAKAMPGHRTPRKVQRFTGALTMVLATALVSRAQDLPAAKASGVAVERTEQSVRRPYVRHRVEAQTVTTYREQYGTSMQDSVRLEYVPRSTYSWQQRWRGWWNPFSRPGSQYQLTPHTRWVPQWEKKQIPVSTRRLVPQTRVVQRPVTLLGFTHRPADGFRQMSPGIADDAWSTEFALDESGWRAARPAMPEFGGIARLEDDPPRASMAVRDDTRQW